MAPVCRLWELMATSCFAALVVAAFALAACGDGGEAGDITTASTAGTTTTARPAAITATSITTTTVRLADEDFIDSEDFSQAAGDAEAANEVTVTFKGAECTYEGPSEFAIDSKVTFALRNTSDGTSAGFAIWKVPDGTTIADIVENTIFGVGAEQSSDMRAAQLPFSPGIEHRFQITLDTRGTWAVNCFVLSEADGEYPAKVFEVSDG